MPDRGSDDGFGPGEPEDVGIILVSIGAQYWLAEGERHIQAMLANDAPYPRPVRCVRFTDMAHLASFLPDAPGGLWAIHPGVIARLRRAGELIEEDPPP